MELAIPFDAFTSINNFFPAKAGTRWAIQAVRQDRNIIDERGRSTSTLFPIYDIFKDVHQPSRFGLMEFVEQDRLLLLFNIPLPIIDIILSNGMKYMVANELAMSSYFLNPGERISFSEFVASSPFRFTEFR